MNSMLESLAPKNVSSAPFPASTAAMEDPRMSKARVEKLKRRIIRAVAGKLSQNPDEKEMENMWSMMQKSCKCDCKLLWKHMRAVTLKKLKRLISADDRVEDITAIARLTLTDWLLYDLVLVHEEIDVIGQEIWVKTGEEPEPLMELFFLVDEYDIESLEGNKLIEAWLNLTKEYNESGRKCSPMLLQRRWYQLKEATRKAFYVFWGKYRGKTDYFQKYAQYKPTALQVDIAKRYKKLILTSFPDWNELIKDKKVILAHEFDNYITSKRTGAKKDTEPDLQVVEQKIDTINIDDDSDTEQSIVETPEAKKIKNETDNDVAHLHDKDIHFLKEMNIPCETPFADDEDAPLVIDCGEVFSSSESRYPNDCQDMDNGTETRNSVDDSDILTETNDINVQVSAIMSNKDNDNTELDGDFDFNVGKASNALYGKSINTCDGSSDSDVTEITDIFNSSQIKIETPFFTTESDAQTNSPENTVEEDSGENDKTEDPENFEANKIKPNDTILPKIESVTSINDVSSTEISVKNILTQKATELELSRKLCRNLLANNLEGNSTKSDENRSVNDLELLGNFDEIPKDLQLVDDGIVLDEDDNVNIQGNEELSSETKTPKIDLKLLLFSTVYTKKLDHMDVFKFIEFDTVRDKRIIESAEIESKPVDLKAVNLEDLSLQKDKEIVKKVADSSIQEENLLNTVHHEIKKESDISIETENTINKDTNNECTNKPNGSEHQSTENDITSEEDEPLLVIKNRVDAESKMFKKPHITNYNPIQLCKNPDFNTRLKRLTAGFLSYEKNREYLKRCHPVTIDLHKTFEGKLIDSTLYLKENKENTNKVIVPIEKESKSINENTNENTNDDVEITSNDITATSTHCERNKVINLPDITEIRRVNQNLLTAEVAPLQVVMNAPSDLETLDQNQNSEIPTVTATLGCKPEIEIPDIIHPLVVEDIVSKIDAGKSTQDSTINKNLNKIRPQQKKPHNEKHARPNLPWNHPGFYAKEEECLLASDTVDKMLALFSGQDITKEKKTKSKKKPIKKITTEPLKNDHQDGRQQSVSQFPSINNNKAMSDYDNIPQSNVTENALAVLSISQKKKKKEFCCWALKKIWYPNLKRKHPCKKPLCTCCCRNKLLEKYKKMRALSLANQQQPTAIEQKANPEKPPEKQPNSSQPEQSVTFGCLDEKQPDQTTSKNKIVVNIPAAKIAPNQSSDLVPSIVIDGNTNKITVPKCIVRHQTRPLNTNNLKDNAPITSKLTTVVPNTDIRASGLEAVEANPLQNRLRVKTNLTNSENLLELRGSKFSLQHPPPLVRFKRNNRDLILDETKKPKRSRTNFCNIISQKIQGEGANKKVTNTVRLHVNKEGKSSASPIFLGENKILLSTVKGPKAQPIPIDPPKIILPEGVHFILLPNNELALSIAPGVELETEQLRHLELVIQALQKVLGTAEPPQNQSIVSDCDEKSMANKDHNDTTANTEKNNDNISSKNKEKISNDEINVTVDKESEDTLNAAVQNIGSSVCDTEPELNNASDNTEKSTQDTQRKTILSDLMEMSGISAEDAKLPEPLVQPAETPNIVEEEANPEMHPDLLRLFNNPVAVAALASRPDLSIITAYSDLKYAVDNNGKFFKMDVCTGEIIRINVFIKQKQQLNRNRVKPITNNELIDLTSDKEDSSNEAADVNLATTSYDATFIPAVKDSRSVLRNKAPNKDTNNIKPLKLFRAMHPSILKYKDTDMCMNTNMRVTSSTMLVGNNTLKVVNMARRKQNLSQGLKIDINNDPKQCGEMSVVNINESDSDDEPLAKKANRNRDTELTSITSSEPTNTDECYEIPIEMNLDEDVVYEEIETEFEHSEDTGEDCILGV